MGFYKQKLIQNKIEILGEMQKIDVWECSEQRVMPPLLGGNHRRVYHVKVRRGKRINICDANDVGKYNTLTLGLTISGVSENPLQTPEWKSIVCRNVLVPLWMMTFPAMRCIKMKP